MIAQVGRLAAALGWGAVDGAVFAGWLDAVADATALRAQLRRVAVPGDVIAQWPAMPWGIRGCARARLAHVSITKFALPATPTAFAHFMRITDLRSQSSPTASRIYVRCE